MSELIVSAGTQSFSDFGLQVINEQPVTLTNSIAPPPLTPPGTVSAVGSSAAETIRAISSTDPTIFTIQGEAGNDIIAGAAGNDILFGGDGEDDVFGLAGDDQIQGNDGDDLLSGGDGNDNLAGQAGSDIISAGAGNDIIQGGGGVDRLTGGAGKDTFVFRKGSTGGADKSAADRITDFAPADDTIQFQGTLQNLGLDPGKLARSQFQSVENVSDLGSDLGSARIIYEESTGLVYGVRTNGTEVALVQLAKNLTITAADFEIF